MITWVLRVCAVIFVALMFFSAWRDAVENREFRAHGQRATVEPLVQYTETTTTKKQLGIQVSQSKSKSAGLNFTTADGRAMTVNKRLPDKIFDQFAAGQPVVIEYLPDSPTTTRFAGETSSPLTTALFGLLSLAAVCVFWKRM